MGRRRSDQDSGESGGSDVDETENKGKRQSRRGKGRTETAKRLLEARAEAKKSQSQGGGATTTAKGFFGEAVPVTATSLTDVTSLALKCHNGKHIKAETNGDLKASSTVIKDLEKFDLIHHEDGRVSLRSHHGKYVTADKNGDVRASSAAVEDGSKFEVVKHESGQLSLKSVQGYVAAEMNGRIRANRSIIGAWERFQLKDRSRKQHSGQKQANGDEGTATDSPNHDGDGLVGIFDAFCQLESVLLAEERYARTHADRTAVAFEKRARARRKEGLEISFRHFRESNAYPSSFRGCLSAWDATAVLRPTEVDEASRQRLDSGVSEPKEPRSRLNSGCSDGSCYDGSCYERPDKKLGARLHWMTILGEEEEASADMSLAAAFGIPAASAAEAEDEDFERLSALCRLPSCRAIGPIGLDCSDLPPAPEGLMADQFAGMRGASIEAEFGAGPAAAYDAHKDPACLAWLRGTGPSSKAETWVLKHGDRRLAEFEAAKADYLWRRRSAQRAVAQRQLRLAKELALPAVLQLPPQDEAERGMAELLVAEFGEGSNHTMLLSAFHGRPKCAAALLKCFPGLVLGFSGLLTHGKLKATLGEVAFDVPMDRFVLESLGPQYPPAGDHGVGTSRGSYSHPAHIALVAEELAQVKRLPVREVLTAALANSVKLLGLPETWATLEEGTAVPSKDLAGGYPASFGLSTGSADSAACAPLVDRRLNESQRQGQKQGEEEAT